MSMQPGPTLSKTLNRRSNPRVEQVVPIHYRANGNSLAYTPSYALDLSVTGARIVTHEEDDPGDTIKLTISFGEGRSVNVEGRKVWERSVSNGRCKVVGVAFLSTGLGGRTAIDSWIRDNRRLAVLPILNWNF